MASESAGTVSPALLPWKKTARLIKIRTSSYHGDYLYERLLVMRLFIAYGYPLIL